MRAKIGFVSLKGFNWSHIKIVWSSNIDLDKFLRFLIYKYYYYFHCLQLVASEWIHSEGGAKHSLLFSQPEPKPKLEFKPKSESDSKSELKSEPKLQSESKFDWESVSESKSEY